MTFTSRSKGIEQLVANDIVSPPGGKPIVAAWDRPVFYVASPDVFPNVHGPDNQHAIVMGLGPRLRHHRSHFHRWPYELVGRREIWLLDRPRQDVERLC